MAFQTELNEIDPQLMIIRIHQGIKLVKPCHVEQEVKKTGAFNTGQSVASLATLPFNFYFLNLQGDTLHMNQQCVEICGFQSAEDSLGKSIAAVSNSKTAQQLINNCQEVITENKIKIFDEQNIRHDGLNLQFLSIKSPWYNEDNKIIGTFGCSIVLGKQSLSQALEQISQLGLLNSTYHSVSHTLPQISHNNETLSERENLCLMHLCQGYTMKEIAKIIGLSPKTIETYIDRAKQKLKCQNKAELIAAYLK